MREVVSSSPISSNALVSVLEIPLDKELTPNCMVETHKTLQELIPATMVDYGLKRVQLPIWLQQSLINGLLWVTVVSEHL